GAVDPCHCIYMMRQDATCHLQTGLYGRLYALKSLLPYGVDHKAWRSIQATPNSPVVSSVKISDPVPVLPGRSVCVALNVCGPSARPIGARFQLPAMSAIVVPSTATPSLTVTRVSA